MIGKSDVKEEYDQIELKMGILGGVWGWRGNERVSREGLKRRPGSTNGVGHVLLYNESFTINCYWRL